MVNTVGSYWKNKKLQKKWIPLKRKLRLNLKQKSILIGSLLGDGTLRLGERAINVNLKIEHGLQQEEYLWWKYQILKDWVFTEPKLSFRYKENREKYLKSWWFRTVRHPILTEYWKLFYPKRKKVIPKTIDKDINPLVLAVWIMDDGSYNKNSIDISTYSFSIKDIERLQKTLKKLVEIIRPFIIPSMLYKVGFPINPVTTDVSMMHRD